MMTIEKRRQRLKTWLSGKLLDLAEQLPESKREPLHYLQELRSWERERSDDTAPRGPGELQLSLPLFRIVEAYSIENFHKLRDALERLFSPLPHHERDLFSELSNRIRSLNSGSWWNIGYIVPIGRRRISGRPVCELPGLPSSVESIDVRVHHVFPSLVALTFDAHLTEAASDELRRIQSRPIDLKLHLSP